MVVYRDKVILPFIFMLVFPYAFAEDEDKYKVQVISAVREEAQIATLELEEAIGKCSEAEKASVPDASYFKDIKISAKEMEVSLIYLSIKAKSECITEARYKDFSYSLIKLRSVLKHYNDSDFEEIDVDEFSMYSHPLPWLDVELSIKYNEIDPQQRAALEQVPGLSKPFQPIKLLKKIEFEIYGAQNTP
ncbi:MAG: hypothetical protein L3J00_06355 [Thiomicrorhabdus sp.]|nr:hypothetical protein [Thiomicrorhabdus sp.]